MRIGIGLPSTIPDIPGRRIVEWAQLAEQRGFSSLATIDRIVYPNHDSLTTLAAAAGATDRIGLATNILLGPVYPPVLLAKATASLDQLSGGRLTLGLAPGGRPDDFAVTGRDFHTRGRDFDHTLTVLHRAWRGEPVEGGDRPVGPHAVHDAVPVLIGGTSDQALRRVPKWGAGWTAGGAGPDAAAPFVEKVRSAWRDAGREGEPRLAALAYFSLGDDATKDSRDYLLDYYAIVGEYAETIATGALRTEAAIHETVRAFADLGFSELYLDPTTSALDQVDRLADVVL
ncbi:MAG TPA: LLM class flavin-dependent oxidoreductase [Actinomycetes bacterium]|jgi:alkanesulfonate monooxygenase SsuD/methylene tetrahydromethanopterin reductase-like flavin-dependent oxidoreductase (luciferase family)|nr:LLM class flavin-dependent oxidoreductase [Actinomycetes bacterium]